MSCTSYILVAHNVIIALLIVLLAFTGNSIEAVITTHVGPRYPHVAMSFVHQYVQRLSREYIFQQSITVASTRTSRPYRINQTLFGYDRPAGATLRIAGSRTSSYNAHVDLTAEQFGLPSDFLSFVYTAPRVKSTILEYSAFFDFDRYVRGLFAQLRVPFVYTNWDMKMRERVIERGANNQERLPSFSDYITGAYAPVFSSTTVHPLRAGKIATRGLTAHGVPEVAATVGYDLYANSCARASISVHGSLPLGNRPTGSYLFEPIIGNEHHVQVGVEITGCWRYLLNAHERESCMVYGSCSADHLFRSRQYRTFDLVRKPLSRYLMALKRGEGGDEMSPVANLTTLSVDVYNTCQVQLTLVLAYEKELWRWAMGYNLFIQTPDLITPVTYSRSYSHSNPRLASSPLDTQINRQNWVLLSRPEYPLTTCDIDLHSGSSKKSINTLFSQVYYHGGEQYRLTPCIGFGGALEMGSTESASKSIGDKGTINNGFSNWSIWVSLGLSL